MFATMKPSELDAFTASLERNESILQAQVDFMKTVANLQRLKIIMILGQVEGEMEQRELQKILGISKANLSQHLALLRTVGVVHSRPAGRVTMLSLRYPAIRDACAMVKDVIARRASELVPMETR
jgi:DNA-binding transcriptional ArsR family regulator